MGQEEFENGGVQKKKKSGFPIGKVLIFLFLMFFMALFGSRFLVNSGQPELYQWILRTTLFPNLLAIGGILFFILMLKQMYRMTSASAVILTLGGLAITFIFGNQLFEYLKNPEFHQVPTTKIYMTLFITSLFAVATFAVPKIIKRE